MQGKGIVIVGAQFGDEGKGKVVDFYSSKSYIHHTVRFNGGANAGHTIVADGIKYALHLLPSGLVFGKSSFIGNGVTLDLEKLDQELQSINETQNKDLLPKLQISERAQLVLPIHKELDKYQEDFKSKLMSGSTKRGVGPTNSDKVNRMGIRFIDLFDESTLNEKLEQLYNYNYYFLINYVKKPEINNVVKQLLQLRDKFKTRRCDVGLELENAFLRGENVLFEGAQSTLLDIDHGIFPYNTSSYCIVPAASTGTGVGINRLNERIGVVKAFTSRVGEGPVMAELDYTKDPGKILQIEGNEFGTTTGRPRRIAWLDLVAIKYACRINSLTGLALTKLDILGLLDEFEVVISYKSTQPDFPDMFNGFPAQLSQYEIYKPVTKKFKGWGKKTSDEWLSLMEKGFNEFPIELQNFINFVEQETKTKVYLIGFGPDRNLTFEKINLVELA